MPRHSTPFDLAQKSVNVLMDKRRKLERQIVDGDAAKLKIAGIEAELKTAEATRDHERRVVDAAQFGDLAIEFDELLDGLDKRGWTPAAEDRLLRIINEFRMAGRSGQSSEALRHFCERVKNPVSFVDRRLRWSNLKGWIKREQKAA